MISFITQTTTNGALFTAVGGATALVANSYKAVLPSIPRPNPFNATPIALSATVGLVITGSYFVTNLALTFLVRIIEGEDHVVTPGETLARHAISGILVITGAAFFGVNPVAALALIISSIVINSLLDQHILQLNAVWGT